MSKPQPLDELPDQSEQTLVPEVKINLPQVPPSVGREVALKNAPVVAHRMHGEPIQGLLHHFDHANSELTIRLRDGTYVTIQFVNLRFLVFSRPLLPATGKPLLGGQKEIETTSSSAKAFELVFNDGRKFHATAETVLVEPFGIHIFLDKPDGHVYRLFAPRNTVNKYNFDISIGKGLVEHRVIGVEHKEVPLGTVTDRLPRIVQAAKDTGQSLISIPDRVMIFPPATCTRELRESLSRKWPLPTQHLGELLLAQNSITEDQLHDALAYQRQHPGSRIGEILVEQGSATPDEIAGVLAFKLGLPFVKLDSFDIDSAALAYFPRELAIRLHLIPLFIYKEQLVVAMSDPTNSDASSMVEFITQHRVEVTVAAREDVDAAIDKHYRRREDDEVIEQFGEIDEVSEEIEEGLIKEAERLGKEKSIVRLVQNMIIEAVRSKASDIHIRPGDNSVDIILRIDGTLITMRNITKSVHAAVVSRIKIIGRMDISERRVPQDGRASINLHGNKVDLRISVMPTINGESVVIRILDTLAGLRSIDQLGFGSRDHRLFKDIISHSYGILLVTGPTGSGKSTTLYAALEHIRKSNVNIITAEDPVEYHINGIEQMQVNHKIDYSFARILRNILRHDPDVIMVGEIRDQETAKTAIESALTGHLVLSTLHTNSAAVTITRLLEMGVEPYLINDTLLGVLAQRLVRVNCPDCVEVEEVDPSVYEALGISEQESFFRGQGCDNCNHTGYKGRMAVYELLHMNHEIRAQVSRGVSADIIHTQAVSGGMTPLTQNALNAAREKKTSLAEVYRVRLE
jgi:type IV pilus assembly protein PilB